MLAKIPASNVPPLKKWAAFARLSKPRELQVIASKDALVFSVSSAGMGRSLYARLAVPAEVPDDGRLVTVPATFFEALAALEGEEYTLAFDGVDVTLSNGKCYFSLKAVMALAGDAEYVKPLKDANTAAKWTAELPGASLRDALGHGAASALNKTDYVNAWVQCVHIQAYGDKMHFESCDRFMLSKAFADATVQGSGNVLLQARLAESIGRILPGDIVTLSQQGDILSVAGKDLLVQTALYDGTFPDTTKLTVPGKGTARSSAVLNVADMRAVADTAVALCADGSRDDSLDLTLYPAAVRAEFREEKVGRFTNDLQAEMKGEPLTVCVGARMLQTILREIASPKVAMYVLEPTSPVKFEPAVEAPREAFIIMPRSAADQQKRPVADSRKEDPKEAAD